jgi:hypothetical protein
MGQGHLKIFSRTTKLIYSQKLPDIVQIQVCTNQGPRGVGLGHNWETHFYMCLYWKKYLKIFSRPSWPISIKIDTNHSHIKGIQVCTYNFEGPCPLQGGDITKIGWGH